MRRSGSDYPHLRERNGIYSKLLKTKKFSSKSAVYLKMEYWLVVPLPSLVKKLDSKEIGIFNYVRRI